MNEPISMDRVGIDGLDGPGGGRRRVNLVRSKSTRPNRDNQTSVRQRSSRSLGNPNMPRDPSRRQNRASDMQTLTDGYDYSQAQRQSHRAVHTREFCQSERKGKRDNESETTRKTERLISLFILPRTMDRIVSGTHVQFLRERAWWS